MLFLDSHKGLSIFQKDRFPNSTSLPPAWFFCLAQGADSSVVRGETERPIPQGGGGRAGPGLSGLSVFPTWGEAGLVLVCLVLLLFMFYRPLRRRLRTPSWKERKQETGKPSNQPNETFPTVESCHFQIGVIFKPS